MRKNLIAFALVVPVLVSCAGEPKTYSGPQEVVSALSDSDISCRDLEITDGGSVGETGHGSLVDERGVCWVEDVEVVISTFDATADRDDWLAVGALLGPTTYGPNWAATGSSDETIEQIGRALDGSFDEV